MSMSTRELKNSTAGDGVFCYAKRGGGRINLAASN